MCSRPFLIYSRILLDQDVLYLPGWSDGGRARVLEGNLHLGANISAQVNIT